MKKRPAHAAVLPLLLVALALLPLLFQVSDCSRPFSPEEPRKTTIPGPVPVLLRDDYEPPEPHVNYADGVGSSTTRPAGLVMMEAAGAVGKKETRDDDDDASSDAATSATTTTTAAPVRDMVGLGHQVGSGSSNNLGGGAQMMMIAATMRPPVRLRSSELPRRVVLVAGAPPVVEGAADTAAKSSCRSSDVHISCPPSRN